MSTENCKHEWVFKAENELGVWEDCRHCGTTRLVQKNSVSEDLSEFFKNRLKKKQEKAEQIFNRVSEYLIRANNIKD